MSELTELRQGLLELADLAAATAERGPELAVIIAAMRDCLTQGGTLFFIGNGGSAADAQHLAAEYVVRLRPGPQSAHRALALTTDTSILTAAANDFGFEEIFARQLQALARPGDLVLMHSTSGNSVNLLRAAQQARRQQLISIAFLGGDGGRLRDMVDHAFVVPGDHTGHIQEIHLALQHQIAAILTRQPGNS